MDIGRGGSAREEVGGEGFYGWVFLAMRAKTKYHEPRIHIIQKKSGVMKERPKYTLCTSIFSTVKYAYGSLSIPSVFTVVPTNFCAIINSASSCGFMDSASAWKSWVMRRLRAM